jgi:cobalt-zinc-cadmium efflux system protein
MDANAGHDHSLDSSARKLALVAGINLVGFGLEVAGSFAFGSVALLADAAHMLFDSLAYVMAFAAVAVATRYEVSERYSYGLHRLEPLSAFLNGLLLVPMVAFILLESVERVGSPGALATGPTLAVAGIGLLLNLASVWVLGGVGESLNERGAFYHLLGDAGASAAVIVSTVVVWVTGLVVVDPIVAALIALVVLVSAVDLLRGSGAVFLHRAPVTKAEASEGLLSVPGLARVRDFHSWQICSEITIATCSVEADVVSVAEVERVVHDVHDVLAGYEVSHATVEVHPASGGLPGQRSLSAHEHDG